ncbi:hypothetical protein B566_EDAN011381 [Ephemera danica]|nr:hypothetical protein B566_EDAN011381 [Ephemera danica]
MSTSTRWSSEFVVAEHKDLQASAMAVDFNGTYALLYGRRYLAVINLDEPSYALKKVLRQSKYEVGTADWNPTSAQGETCAISSNQRVEILRWMEGGDLTTEQTLRAHTRVVADLHWHRSEPNLLASCSLDTFVHIWDLRDTRRPALSLSAVVGATHVRWNKISRHILASAHEGDIKVWDQRKGTAPVQYISAHLAKIHGLDWNPSYENQLVTSSQDCTVKYFDITSPRRAESVLTFTSPVWRARYTPFGTGLVTVVVSPIRREENSLLLWNTSNQGTPVHTFVGHTDVVQEVSWRGQREGSVDFQLVTWCKDQSLRIWRIEPFLQKLCGHEAQEGSEQGTEALEPELLPSAESAATSIVDPSNAVPQLGAGEKDGTAGSGLSQPPKTLQQEFSLTNINIPNVQVDAMDAVRRTCTVTASTNGHTVVLLVNFPANYPFNSPPSFQLCKGTTIDSATQAKVVKVLKQTAQQRVRKNKSCLEPCLRQLVATLEQIAQLEETTSVDTNVLTPFLQSSQFLEPSSLYGSFKDAYIPFPRTSGAAFCSVGHLVCFSRPVYGRRVSVRSDTHPTPRSLSALGPTSGTFVTGSSLQLFGSSQGSSVTSVVAATGLAQVPETASMSSFYFPDRQRARSKGRNSASGPSNHRGSIAKTNKPAVILYDVSPLLFVQRELAEKYKLSTRDVSEACQHNASVALMHGRRDLAQVWQLVSLAAASPIPPSPLASHWSEHDEDSLSAWVLHPFGRTMIESLIMHYAGQFDVQTAAMLSCMFGCRTENQAAFRKKATNKNVSVRLNYLQFFAYRLSVKTKIIIEN